MLVQLQRIEKSGRLLVPAAAQAAAQPNAPLVKLLARAHQLQSMLAATDGFEAIARRAGLSQKRAA